MSQKKMFEGEVLDMEKLSTWNKPDEWDSKLGRAFLQMGTELLKPIKNPEAYFYIINPEEEYKVKAPEDVDPRSDTTIKKVMNFANCPDGLRPIIPRFFGLKSVSGHPYLSMENLMYGMKNAAMCDVKLGIREHDPFANSKKISDTIDRFSKRVEYGFRVVGMRTWDDKDNISKRSKAWGSELVKWEEQIEEDFAKKFILNMTDKQKKKLMFELEKMDKLWSDVGSKEILIFSSSLMIVYESAVALGNDKEGGDNFDPDRIEVKLIDFAHSFYRKDHPEVEDGCIRGIRNVRRAFLKVLTGSTGDLGDGPKMD